MPLVRKLVFTLVVIGLACLATGLFRHDPGIWQPAAVFVAVALALGLAVVPALRGYPFTGWIIAAVTAAMIYPVAFQKWGDVDLRHKWLVLVVVQLVMFGMGTQMKLRDFAGVLKTPWGVLVGMVCQFTIMPLVGFALITVFSFPPEIGAGVILIGSCSSGLASNVMTWLARGNLPLSVTMTACATVLAPFITPLWMTLLAGEKVPVSYFGMMMEIVKIVIVPIGAALLHDGMHGLSAKGRRVVHLAAAGAGAWLVVLALGAWGWIAQHLEGNALTAATIPGFFAGAIIAGVAYHEIVRRLPAVQRAMPVASMAGIIYFTLVTTAAGRDALLVVGALLFVAAVLHNTTGYFLGYWLSRLCGLDRISARTIAFEVGLQNGGMASGLASAMGKLGTVGLAAAIFSPWMNVSGSLLANFWRRRPVDGS